MSPKEVKNWQRFLKNEILSDVKVDGIFGKQTEEATKKYQRSRGLPDSGVLCEKTRKISSSEGFIQFISAKNQGRLRVKTDLIVIHTMESPEGIDTAKNVASWFAGVNPKYSPPMVSAHYCIDAYHIFQCVEEEREAWHAGKVNSKSIGIELSGRANQTKEQWADEYSLRVIEKAAALAYELCERYGIPKVRLTPEELKEGKRGICGHNTVNEAFPSPRSTHWDPGPCFPWELFLQRVSSQS